MKRDCPLCGEPTYWSPGGVRLHDRTSEAACRTDTVIVRLSGRTYGECVVGSSVPEEEGWPEPTVRKVGAGTQYVYEVTAEQRLQICTHLEDLHACSSGFDNEDGGATKLREAVRRDLIRAEHWRTW